MLLTRDPTIKRIGWGQLESLVKKIFQALPQEDKVELKRVAACNGELTNEFEKNILEHSCAEERMTQALRNINVKHTNGTR